MAAAAAAAAVDDAKINYNQDNIIQYYSTDEYGNKMAGYLSKQPPAAWLLAKGRTTKPCR